MRPYGSSVCQWLTNHPEKQLLSVSDSLSPPQLSWSVLCFVGQSCLTLCNPMDWSPSGSSVHGILQARILDWVAIPFSRGSSWSRYWTQLSCTVDSFPAEPPGKPLGGSDGSVVKALDLKSNEVSLCRFKPCLLGKWLALGFPGVCACKEWDTTEQWTHSLSNQLYSHKK